MRYFADTSFWLALLSRQDEHHEKALECRNQVGKSQIVTTDQVLWEMLNCCAASPLRSRVAVTCEKCLSDPQIQVIESSQVSMRRALDLYKSRPDKHWSLTDCFSFLVMEEQQIQNALTSDHHFQQAGYRAMLRAEP